MVCQFCGLEKKNITLKVKSKIDNNLYDYYICKKCGSIYQYLIPTKEYIENYYNNYYEIKQQINPGYLTEKNKENFFKERDKTLKDIEFPFERIAEKNNVELGCANGGFLLYLKQNGAKNITGLDISKTLIDSINIEGIKLLNGDLSLLENKSVDNLYLFHILEHTNIKDAFNDIVRVTKDDSIIVVEIPLAGFVSGFFKEKWRFLMPNEHLNIPTLKGLKILLKRYNLKIVKMKRFGSGLTMGMVNHKIKKIFDFLAKKFSFGDRGAFLIKKIK